MKLYPSQLILSRIFEIPWKYVPDSQITIQMNEAFPKRPVHLRTGTRDQEQKLIRPENTPTPQGLKSFETWTASEDPESHLRQTAGDQKQKLIKCEDPESHLRQTAGDQEQQLESFNEHSCFFPKSIDFVKNRSNWRCSNYSEIGYQTVTHHFEMSSLLRDVSKCLQNAIASAKMDKPESRPGQGRETEPGTGLGTGAMPPSDPKPGTQIYL